MTLCLDLGTNTGFCIKGAVSGTICLATNKELVEARKTGMERRLDPRFKRLFEFVTKTVENNNVKRIVFEDVIFMTSQAQAQLWARFSAVIWAVAITHNLETEAVPVGTLKKFATGNGGADKNDMAEALKRKYERRYDIRTETVKDKPVKILTVSTGCDERDLDDNEVDAIWLGEFAEEVDAGRLNFSSIWSRKNDAKKAKKEKKSLKVIGGSKKVRSFKS